MTATTSFWCDSESGGASSSASRPFGTYYQEIWPWMLHHGGTLPETRFLAFDGRIYKGSVTYSWCGQQLVTEMKANTVVGRQVHQLAIREVIGAELHMTLKDKLSGFTV